MFTGIIEAVGEIAEMQQVGGDMRLRIRTGKLDLSDVKLGDSICTSGCCLTVTELPGDALAFARELYATLHRLDEGGAAVVAVQQPPDDPAWRGVADRLRRGSTS